MNIPKHLGGHLNTTHIDIGTIQYLINDLNIKSILDIGCGVGKMKEICHDLEINWTGIDGDISCSDKQIINHDYTTGPYNHVSTYDLAWSVEFLEHVYPEFIPFFMNSFQRCKFVCVTHALPGKAGHHHVNCQLPEYWIDVFSSYNFKLLPEQTSKIRELSTMNREFMRNTGLFFINLTDLNTI